MENNWLEKPEQSHNLLSMISELNERGMYYNITKPKSWSGQPLDISHWSDNYERKPSTYANFPKLWGDPKEAGTRFWNEPAEGESNMIKDTFGFGTEKPAPKLDEVDEKVKNAYVIDKHEDLEKLLISDVGEKDYVHTAIKFERDKIKRMLEHDKLDLGGDFDIFKNLQRNSINKRYNKSYDELYDIYSKAYQKAQKHREENTSAVQRFVEKQTNIPYYNIGSKTKGIIEL